MNVSIILPIFNEDAVIEETIHAQMKAAADLFDSFEILAVNDGSTDETAKKLEKLANIYPALRILDHTYNKGYGAALRSGLNNAKNEWIFFTDADRQFDLHDLDRFIGLNDHFDFIVGFRQKRADSLKRIIISDIYNKLNRILFGLALRDVDCAFKLMRKSAVESTQFHSDSFFVSVELMTLASKKGFRITELGVNHYPRANGESKVTLTKVMFTLFDLGRLYLSTEKKV